MTYLMILRLKKSMRLKPLVHLPSYAYEMTNPDSMKKKSTAR